jgi:hypothetical protein
MGRDDAQALLLEDRLRTLGIESVCQWDVLVFLYRHQDSLANAQSIGRLLGYGPGETLTSLEGLETLGLVERSRVHRGVRLYGFVVPPDSRRGDALGHLLTLADNRTARLLLVRKLRRPARPDQDNRPGISRRQGRFPWLKAI